jgi:3-oxoacyl-[acyl-carrier-protein] synthase II
MNDAIWITGIGVRSPLGNDVGTVADNLLQGRSGIERIAHFDVSNHPSQIAAPVHTIPQLPDVSRVDWPNLTRLEQISLSCVRAAMDDAGISHVPPERIGLAFGNAGEWAFNWEDDVRNNPERVPCDPAFDRPPLMPFLKRHLNIAGPSATLSTACASGNYALSQARRWLQLGWCDVCLAGACDTLVTPLTLAGFGNLRAVSRRNDDPTRASRPFDVDRDGFVLGEGGTMFVLERASSARARGAKVYGELAGVGMTSDAHHPVIPAPKPTQAIRAITAAMDEARISPADVSYLNAHGTSTPVGDIVEANAIRTVLGRHAATVPVSSTKSMTGHLITAAASFEALACLIAIARNALPPTINLDRVDPECDLFHVANVAREFPPGSPVTVALSNSFGFGGSNSCAAFRRVANLTV